MKLLAAQVDLVPRDKVIYLKSYVGVALRGHPLCSKRTGGHGGPPLQKGT